MGDAVKLINIKIIRALRYTPIWSIVIVFAVAFGVARMFDYVDQPETQTVSQSTDNRKPSKQREVTKPLTTEERVDRALKEMSLRQKIEQMFVINLRSADSTDKALPLNRFHPSGIIMTGDNFKNSSLDSLRNFTSETQAVSGEFPFLIMTDQEGCTVHRVPSDDFLCPPELGNLPLQYTADAYRSRSDLLSSVGINMSLGVVADLANDASEFMYYRSFGSDVNAVSERVAQAVKASDSVVGQYTTIKHFPGHSPFGENSHFNLQTSDISYTDWQNTIMPPFKAGIDAGADAVMFGHFIYSQIDSLPTSLSPRWHDILRNELGFKGLIMTDDMVMLETQQDVTYSNRVQNVVDAINAGNDLIMLMYLPEQALNLVVDGVLKSVDDGQVSINRINDSVRRILLYRANLLD